MPTAESCTQAIDGALGWILAHLEEFDPFRRGDPFEVKNGQKVGEIAILLQAYVGVTGDRDGEAPRRFVALLESVYANRQFSERLLRSPAELVLFAEVYAGLRSVGRDEPGRRAQLERALAAGLLEHNERLPHRMMDIASCLEAGGFDHPWPSLDELYGTSILGRIPSALFLNEDGLYALTHVLMFLYRFGSRPASPPPHQMESLRRLLSTLMIVMTQERHWDLLAELLLCWEAIGYPPTAISERCWEVLLSRQDATGALPGPEWAVPLYAAAEGLGKVKPEDAYFSHYYHTTLVSTIAICLCRRNLESGRPELARDAHRETPPPVEPMRLAGVCAGAASRAERWLTGLAATVCSEPQVRRESLYHLLLGGHLAAGAVDRRAPWRSVARRIAERLGSGGVLGSDEEAPPFLALAAAGVLAAAGLETSALNGPDGFAARAAELLAALPASDPVEDLPLCDKRALLYALGLLSAPCGVGLAETVAYAGALPIGMPPEALEGLLQRIGSLTAWGTRPVDLGEDGPWLEELLSATAIRLLRGYDLATAARTLRSLAYLGLCGAGWRQGIDFLLLQQRDEGSFGLFAAEEGKMSAARQSFAPDTDLYLLTTVECLWTLAESRGWRLFASFRPSERAGPPAYQSSRSPSAAGEVSTARRLRSRPRPRSAGAASR